MVDSARVLPARRLLAVYLRLSLCATLCLSAAPALALEAFRFEPNYIVDPGHTIKDHCLIRRDGVWHCFYIRGLEGQSGTSSEYQLGHAISADLSNWTILPPALTAGPGGWDGRNVWAPAVIPTPGLSNHWTMFYTGANANIVQRGGKAYSTDSGLLTWSKYALNPLFEPDESTYLWEPTLNFAAFRDPFYFYSGGQHHLLHTALLRDASLAAGKRGAVHHLVSDDFVNWTELDPLLLHNGPANQAWHEIESVQLTHARNKWHFFFSELNMIGVHYLQSSQMDSGWDFATRIQFDLGTAPEITPTGDGGYLFSRHAQAQHLYDGSSFWVVRLDSLRFDLNAQPVKVPIQPLDLDWPIRSGSAFQAAPTFGDNAKERGETPVELVGNGYLSSSEYYGGPISNYGGPGSQLGGFATGTMLSRSFLISGSWLRLRVAGGSDPLARVQLVRDSDGAVLYSSSGLGNPVLQEIQWDLSPYIGNSVHLEIRDESTASDAFIHVDEIHEALSGTPAPGPVAGLLAARLLPLQPNPWQPNGRIQWAQTREGRLELRIHDARGRLVREFGRGRLAPGDYDLSWDGRDAQGRTLANGVYFIRLDFEGTPTDRQAVTLLR